MRKKNELSVLSARQKRIFKGVFKSFIQSISYDVNALKYHIEIYDAYNDLLNIYSKDQDYFNSRFTFKAPKILTPENFWIIIEFENASYSFTQKIQKEKPIATIR